MLAAKFVEAGKPLALVETDKPVPSPGHTLLRVLACGVCGSDLSILEGHHPVKAGITLGHEIAGATPDGRRWAVPYASGCGNCAMCRKGWVAGCEHGSKRLGLTMDGGFAEWVSVPTESLVEIPGGVESSVAALCTDAVATGIHAIMDNGRLLAGERIIIFGIGGLGVAAIQIAKKLGAYVTAVSRSLSKRDFALSLGADEFLVGGEDTDSFRGVKADMALQLVPNPRVDEQAIASVRQGGRVVMVAFTPDPFMASSRDIVTRQIQIIGSRGMTKGNVSTALQWVSDGSIHLEKLASSSYSLEEINEVLGRFRAGEILRAVITP